ncbi:MAG TPA: M64 family metallopeptidase [Planctomycetota bacterium]|nr:M64 family metallopeptidase [Planctomycetota bacterium]
MRLPLAAVLLAVASPSLLAQSATSMLENAKKLSEDGKYELAREVLTQLLRKHPSSPEAEIARDLVGDNAFLRVKTLEEHGSPENRIDVYVLGDGYTIDAQDAFDTAARNVPKTFFLCPTLAEYRNFFNFRQMNVASHEDGLDRPTRTYDTAMHGKETGPERAHVTVDYETVRRYLRYAPDSEGLAVVIVKRGGLGTGGDGIAVIGGGPDMSVVHEFGHSFGGLLDEYVDPAGHAGANRRSVNVTDDPDPARVPWKHWLDAGVRSVKIYEGAAGRLKGAWKSNTGGCVMEQGDRDFCVVCREQMVREIYRRVSPIDQATPAETVVSIGPSEKKEFTVKCLRPETHPLEVEWRLERRPIGETAPPPRAKPDKAPRNRTQPALAPVAGDKVQLRSGLPPGTSGVALFGSRLEAGRYLLTARVHDPTPKDGGHPWVLADPEHLLEDRVSWVIAVAGTR